jgi:hypothetical protein
MNNPPSLNAFISKTSHPHKEVRLKSPDERVPVIFQNKKGAGDVVTPLL